MSKFHVNKPGIRLIRPMSFSTCPAEAMRIN